MFSISERIIKARRESLAARESKRRFWFIASCVAIGIYALAGIFTAWVIAR